MYKRACSASKLSPKSTLTNTKYTETSFCRAIFAGDAVSWGWVSLFYITSCKRAHRALFVLPCRVQVYILRLLYNRFLNQSEFYSLPRIKTAPSFLNTLSSLQWPKLVFLLLYSFAHHVLVSVLHKHRYTRNTPQGNPLLISDSARINAARLTEGIHLTKNAMHPSEGTRYLTLQSVWSNGMSCLDRHNIRR